MEEELDAVLQTLKTEKLYASTRYPLQFGRKFGDIRGAYDKFPDFFSYRHFY